MMKARLFAFTGVAAALLCAATLFAGEVKLDGIKCLMNPKANAKAATAVDYKKGKVYFCCKNCAGAFAKAKEKKAVEANAQLVATGQYKQEKCPFSGGKLNADQFVKINGTKVGFCCGNCKGKAAKAEGKKQAELVFNDKAFEKAFVVAKKSDKK